jgi:uncharacterized protein YjbI with pentapeptide repeats
MANKTQLNRFVRWLVFIVCCVTVAWVIYLRFVKNQPWADWTGFETKNLWDLLELLIVPAILAGGALWFNEQRNKTEREIALNRSLDIALLSYLNDMSEFMLEKGLRTSEPGADIRELARAKTLTVLQGLDGKRKGILIRFLYQSKLITKDNLVLDLSGADLNDVVLNGNDISDNRDRTFISYLSLADVQLFGTNLRDANFAEAKLSGASLVMADLSNADLSDAHLMFADLRNATLTGANLSNANLLNANLSGATGITTKQVSLAKSLTGATLPDGSKHE